jgi:hypothetical protein
MDAAVEKMEAQLKLWNLRIDHLAAKTQMVGVQARFDALMYVDELKALHAIAQSKLIEFKATAVGDTRRARVKAEMTSACNELESAFKTPKPSPPARKKLRPRRIADSAGLTVEAHQVQDVGSGRHEAGTRQSRDEEHLERTRCHLQEPEAIAVSGERQQPEAIAASEERQQPEAIAASEEIAESQADTNSAGLTVDKSQEP